MQVFFEDRSDAGRRLAAALQIMDLRDPVVLALPRGGVPVAAEIARALGAPMDLLLVRKIGAPLQPEFAIAAIVGGPEPMLEVDRQTMQQTGASMDYIEAEIPQHLEEMERRQQLYLHGRPAAPVAGRTVVLVDDGIATGTTVRAALRSLRRRMPARIVLAVPVAPNDEAARLHAEVDDLVCLAAPAAFGSVGEYYRNFSQTSDEEVLALLAKQP